MKKIISIFLSIAIMLTFSVLSISAAGGASAGGAAGGQIGGNSGMTGDDSDYETDGESSAEAEALAQIINAIQEDACTFEENVVTLEDDLTLTETIFIPIGENVTLDINRYDIIASGDFEAIYVPENASLTIEGRGMIIGGTAVEQGKCAIRNKGTLTIDHIQTTIIGGGTVIEEEPSGGGSSSGSGGGSSGSSAGGGSTKPGFSESPSGGPAGDYETDITEIPGTASAQIGGAGIHNEGSLHLMRGKIVGGLGTESNGPAISGNITGGECIVHSDDDQIYELINSASTDKQYIFFREATTAEELYVTLVIAESGCCEYEYSYDEENDEYSETIKLLSDVTIPSFIGNIMGGGVDLDTNGYTLNILPDEEESAGFLYSYGIVIRGNGTINGDIGFANANIESGTINGELCADALGMGDLIINGGTINGFVCTLGGTLTLNDGIINGVVEALSTDVVVNGGVISGGTNSWPFEIGESLGSHSHNGELLWQHVYDGNLGTIWVRYGNVTVNGGTIEGWVDNDGKTGHPAITYTLRYEEEAEPHLFFNKGTITGGIGTETSGAAVEVIIQKGENTIIKESDDGKYWSVLEEDTTEKTYLKAGTEYCLSIKNGTAFKSHDLNTPVMEAIPGDIITVVADSAPDESLFKEWNVSGVTVSDLTNKTITFTMPESNVFCEAIYISDDWYKVVAGETSAIMNGEAYSFQTLPVSHNNKVFASARELAEGMNLECEWNAETQEITFSTDNKQLSFVLENQNCTMLNDTVSVDVKAVMDAFLAEDFWVFGDENRVIAKIKTDENTATITLSAQNGSTKGAGDYYKGSSVTVSTTTNSGYSFSGWYEGETNVSSTATYTFVADTDKALVAKSSKSHSGGGGHYIEVVTLSQVVENADGTVTYVETDHKTGKITKKTKLLDGTDKVEEIFKDGTEITTINYSDGDTIKTTKYPDGTKITEKKMKNGVGIKSVTTVANETSASVTGIREEKTEVVIPNENVSNGMVAVLICDDGTEKVIKDSIPTDDGIAVSLSEDSTIKIIDRAKEFTDTNDHWATDSIDFVVARDLYKGTSTNEFSPDMNMTRGMFAVVLHNYEDNPEFKENGKFADVTDDSWYSEAVNWLHAEGVISGYENGNFGAEDNITREQLITLFYRYAGSPQHKDADIDFKDAEDISEYAKDAIIWATQNSLITGKGLNKLDPKGLATRAECAAIIQRFIKAQMMQS